MQNRYIIRLVFTDKCGEEQISLLEFNTFEEMKEHYDRIYHQTITLMKYNPLYRTYDSLLGYSLVDGKRTMYKHWWKGKKL